MLIDIVLIMVPTLFIGGFIIVGIARVNPAAALFGQIADVVLAYDNPDVNITPLPLAMLYLFIVHAVIASLYYTLLESGGRRTPGKAIMHLDIIGIVNGVPSMKEAFLRNLVKIVAGSVGGYLLGGVGIPLFTGIALIVDRTIAQKAKPDIRMRYTEVMARTIVLFEDDEVEIGTISLEGAPSIESLVDMEIARQEKERAKKVSAPQDKAQPELGPTAVQKRTLGGPARSLGSAGPARQLSPGPAEKREISLSSSKEDAKRTEIDEKVLSSESGKDLSQSKGTFFSRILSKAPMNTREVKGPVPDKKDGGPGRPETPGKGIVPGTSGPSYEPPPNRDGSVLAFMIEFDIDEARGQAIYDMGYRRVEDLSDAIAQDLMMIKGINPTIAKRIVARAGGRDQGSSFK